MTDKSNLYIALAKAQTEMGKASTDKENTFFNGARYATLTSVMDACLPALNANDIAVIQPFRQDEHGRYVRTIFIHGPSGERAECDVPLILGKQDMQGLGSAMTYARRYGLMSMAGIAPEDDDGNAAAANAPKLATAAHMKRQLEKLKEDFADVNTEVALETLWKSWARKMHDENWPRPEIEDDENAYRNVVKDMFRRHKLAMNEPVLEAAE